MPSACADNMEEPWPAFAGATGLTDNRCSNMELTVLAPNTASSTGR